MPPVPSASPWRDTMPGGAAADWRTMGNRMGCGVQVRDGQGRAGAGAGARVGNGRGAGRRQTRLIGVGLVLLALGVGALTGGACAPNAGRPTPDVRQLPAQTALPGRSLPVTPAPTGTPNGFPPPTQPLGGAMKVTASGLQYEDMVVGTGAEAMPGQTVRVHYTGFLKDGSKFDSSVDRNQPFPFPLGAGRVIKGWDEGVAGMKVGGKRRLVIPPDLAYGAGGSPPVIPANATLTFDVELLAVS